MEEATRTLRPFSMDHTQLFVRSTLHCTMATLSPEELFVDNSGTGLRRDVGAAFGMSQTRSRGRSAFFSTEGRIWVDIGTAGQVRLNPPVGSTIPFSLWIHTHPWDAYWSPTDLATLAAYSGSR